MEISACFDQFVAVSVHFTGPFRNYRMEPTNNFKQSFYSTIYNTFIKRNSVFVTTIFVGAFAFQGFFDAGITAWYENHNKGKLWKDIKGKYTGDAEEEDDE